MKKQMKDNLGDRMKFYESRGKTQLLTTIPVIARLDGKAFHSFTRDLNRPFDEDFNYCMTDVAYALVKLTNACIGYTQSDEITLIWQANENNGEVFFNGRHEKMVSVLASYATLFFNEFLKIYLPKKSDQRPVFDCRVWNVPSENEAANCLIWREQDATRNSINMAGQSVYNQGELDGKNSDQVQEMLFKKGINWNNYPDKFKRGTYIQRSTIEKQFSTQDLEKLPPKHQARLNPELKVKRQVVGIVKMPQLTKVINRNDIVFRGATPQVKND